MGSKYGAILCSTKALSCLGRYCIEKSISDFIWVLGYNGWFNMEVYVEIDEKVKLEVGQNLIK
jgi:hypothetical protein